MSKKQSHCRLSMHPYKRRVRVSMFVLTFLLVWVLTTYVHGKEIFICSEMTTMLTTFYNAFLANDFGVLAVLFGLCLFTLFIGFRMLLCPVVKQN